MGYEQSMRKIGTPNTVYIVTGLKRSAGVKVSILFVYKIILFVYFYHEIW